MAAESPGNDVQNKRHTIHVWYISLHQVDFMVNVGKYTIHTWYGKDIPLPERDDQWHWKFLHFPLLEHLNLVICSRASLQGLMRITWLLYHCPWFIGVGVEHPFCSYNVTISKGILLSISASQAQWERLQDSTETAGKTKWDGSKKSALCHGSIPFRKRSRLQFHFNHCWKCLSWLYFQLSQEICTP